MSTHRERRDQIHHSMPELHSHRVLYNVVCVIPMMHITLLELGTGMHMPSPKTRMPNEDRKHYTSRPLPHIVRVNGVGSTIPEGKLVYFTPADGGKLIRGMVNIPKSYVFDLPEGAKPEAVATMVNLVMSSWMVLKLRVDMAKLPKEGWTALIVSATSARGVIAATTARILRVTEVYRAACHMSMLIDVHVIIGNPVTCTDRSQLDEVDVILDYLYGPLVAHLLSTLSQQRRPLQYVQIGTITDHDMALPRSVLRSKDLAICVGPVWVRGDSTSCLRSSRSCCP